MEDILRLPEEKNQLAKKPPLELSYFGRTANFPADNDAEYLQRYEVVMEFNIIPDKEALSKCTWCHSQINDHTEVLGLGVKLSPDVDLSEYESHCIQIGLVSEEKPIYMMVTVQGSEASNNGNDGMFLICSKKCGKKLKKVLEKEISSGAMFETVRL